MIGRFVSADLVHDQHLRLDGVPYCLSRNAPDDECVTLIALDGTETCVSVPRAKVFAQLCLADAVLVDPITRRSDAADMPSVSVLSLETAAKIQWYDKMIALRGLMKVSRKSPKSPEFQRAYADVVRLLEWSRKYRLLKHPTTWSAKRLNAVLRDWRHHGGAIAALLKQISPARRAKPESESTEGVRNVIKKACLLYTSDAADDLLCVDLGGRRIIKKKIKS